MWRNIIKETRGTHESYKGGWGEKDSIAQSLAASAASTYVQKETNDHDGHDSSPENRPQYAMSPRPV